MNRVADLFKTTSQNSADTIPATTSQYKDTIQGELGSGDANTDPNNPFALGKISDKVSVKDMFGIATRGAVRGLTELGDTFADALTQYTPAGNALKTVTGLSVSDLLKAPERAKGVLDTLKVPEALTNNEKIADQAIASGIQFAVPIGGEASLGRAALDIGAGLGAGAAQEKARQGGAGPIAQTLINLGVGGSLLAAGHFATSLGPKASKIVTDLPPEQAFTEDGSLTNVGKQAANDLGVSDNQFRSMYEDAKDHTDAIVQKHYDEIKSARDELLKAKDGLKEAESQGYQVDPQKYIDIEESLARGNKALDELEPHLPKEPIPETYKTPEPIDTRTPEERIADAKDINPEINLSKGKATQDYAQIQNEDTLAGNTTAPEGAAAREHNKANQDALIEGHQRLADRFNPEDQPDLVGSSQAEKGAIIQNSIASAEEASKQDYIDKYKKLSANKTVAPIDLSGEFKNAMLKAASQAPEASGIKADLYKILAKRGLVGKVIDYFPESQETHVRLDNGTIVKVPGRIVKPTLHDAEIINQELNKSYTQGYHNPQLTGPNNPKELLNKLVDNRLKELSNTAKLGSKVSADQAQVAYDALQARTARRNHAKRFEQKDIVSQILGKKSGTDTDKLSPEKIVDKVLGTKPVDITDLKKIKVMLLAGENNKVAWQAIKAHGVSKLFENIIDADGNISATKLNANFKRLGDDKMRLLFDPSEYNQLQKFRRVVNDLNAKGKGTTPRERNHLLQILYHSIKLPVLTLGHGASHIASLGFFAISDLLERNNISKTLKQTLDDIKSYDPKSGAKIDEAKEPIIKPEHINELISYISSREFLSPLMTANLHSKEDN